MNILMRHLIKPIRKNKLVILSTAIRIAKIVARYGATGGRIISGESALVSRFPPAYRPYVKDILRAVSIATTGGVISDLLGNGQYGTVPSQLPPGKQQKKYSRNIGYSRSRYSVSSRYNYKNRRRCKPCKPRRSRTRMYN